MTALFACLALTVAQQTQPAGPYDLAVQRLTESVYIVYRPAAMRMPVHGNVTIIVNENDVVVVDAGSSPAAARHVIQTIRSITDNPVSVLVNTHGHEDHVLGNQEFVKSFPKVAIVARLGTRDYLVGNRVRDRVRDFAADLASRRATGSAEIRRVQRGASEGNDEVVRYLRQYYEEDIVVAQLEYRRVTVTPPTVTFEEHLTLHRGDRTIELLNLGPGKAGSDVVVYLPEEKIVVAGDVITHPIPYGFARRPVEWLETIKQLAALDFEYLVPGHGDVLTDRSYLNQVIGLVEFEIDAVRRAITDGRDPESTLDEIDFSRWMDRFANGDPILRYRFQTWFVEPAVARAHAALSSGH